VTPLLRGGDVHDIEQLKRAGLSVSAISVMTGYDRKTVRSYLRTREAVPIYGPRAPRPGKLDPFRDYFEERLSAGAWNAVVLLRELKQRGYSGGYSILKEYLEPKRRRLARSPCGGLRRRRATRLR